MNDLMINENDNENNFLIAPKNFSDAMEIAKTICNSDFVPPAFKGKPIELVLIMESARMHKLHFMQVLGNYCVINGKPGIYGDLMLALIKREACFEDIDETVTENEAICTVKRKNQTAQSRKYTMQDAAKAKLLNKQNWQTNPKRMMQMRARAFALRDVFPDVLQGFHSREELEDYQSTEKDITPKNAVSYSEFEKTSHFKKKSDVLASYLSQSKPKQEVYNSNDFEEDKNLSTELNNDILIEEIKNIDSLEEIVDDEKDILIEKITEITAHNENASLSIDKWISRLKATDPNVNTLNDFTVNQLELSLSKLDKMYRNNPNGLGL